MAIHRQLIIQRHGREATVSRGGSFWELRKSIRMLTAKGREGARIDFEVPGIDFELSKVAWEPSKFVCGPSEVVCAFGEIHFGSAKSIKTDARSMRALVLFYFSLAALIRNAFSPI
jgi:hypothetical protein